MGGRLELVRAHVYNQWIGRSIGHAGVDDIDYVRESWVGGKIQRCALTYVAIFIEIGRIRRYSHVAAGINTGGVGEDAKIIVLGPRRVVRTVLVAKQGVTVVIAAAG